jgi:hypothetical protein
VDFSAKDILQHLDWGVFAKGEIRKGRWGILADGFFAQLSASGDPPGSLRQRRNYHPAGPCLARACLSDHR